MAVAVPAALVPVAAVGFDVVPRGFQGSLSCDLEFSIALGMAREVIGECRDGFRVQVQGVEFLRVDRSERSAMVCGTAPGGWIEGVSEESRSGV